MAFDNKNAKTSSFLKAMNKYASKKHFEIIGEIKKLQKAEMEKAEQRIIEDIKTLVQKETTAMKNKILITVSHKELEEKRKVAQKRHKAINEIFENVKNEIIEFTKTPKYAEFLKKTAAKVFDYSQKNLKNTEVILYIKPEDEQFKNILLEEFKGSCKVKISEKIEIGGFQAHFLNENIMIDETLEAKQAEQEKNFFDELQTEGLQKDTKPKCCNPQNAEKNEVCGNVDVVYSINGPVVTVKNTKTFSMMEMVYVGCDKLIGEVINVSNSKTVIQVYEETTGLMRGEPVIGTGTPMSVLLGPGLINNIFDGIERPLKAIEKAAGAFVSRGQNVKALDEEKLWNASILVKKGEFLNSGDIFASCPETSIITHKCLVPPNVFGEVITAKESGNYTICDVIVKIKDKHGNIHDLTLSQTWPIRTPRPVNSRLPANIPLITGQRVIDTLFPIAKGGAAAVPGGFGTGKTMTQHQLAKWCDADIIVYVGCGERGNEMCQVVEEFSKLIDPKSEKPMMERTVLIANTSNMPVAAREASIYTGITIAEYYRDMGYDVAIMADSTSRWAEALREISGRLEEMPAEEGFPAYLPSRLSEFYERAGRVTSLCKLEGSVTIIGAVSPQGSDFSEPVTQNTKRFTRCFWALDKSLAYARHYPSINWINSYSEYFVDLDPWYSKNFGDNFIKYRKKIAQLLLEEDKLMEIVKLVGSDILPDDQKLIIEIAKLIRVGFLQQNAFHADDTFVPLKKQKLMMQTILYLNKKVKQLISAMVPISKILKTGIFEKVSRIKYDIPNNRLELFKNYLKEIDEIVNELIVK